MFNLLLLKKKKGQIVKKFSWSRSWVLTLFFLVFFLFLEKKNIICKSDAELFHFLFVFQQKGEKTKGS